MVETVNNRNRIIAIFMLVILALSVFGVMDTLATTDALASTTGSSVFDIVGDNGSVNLSSGGVTDSANTEGSIKTVLTKGKAIAVGFTGIATIIMLICMIIQFVKLGAAGDNEVNRKKATMGIMTTGIATALLGGVTVVVGFFWNALNGN